MVLEFASAKKADPYPNLRHISSLLKKQTNKKGQILNTGREDLCGRSLPQP